MTRIRTTLCALLYVACIAGRDSCHRWNRARGPSRRLTQYTDVPCFLPFVFPNSGSRCNRFWEMSTQTGDPLRRSSEVMLNSRNIVPTYSGLDNEVVRIRRSAHLARQPKHDNSKLWRSLHSDIVSSLPVLHAAKVYFGQRPD